MVISPPLPNLAVPVWKNNASSALSASAKPAKIFFFYQDFGVMGGIERYLVQTTQWLRERGHFDPVVACCENTPLYTALKAAGVQTYGLPSHPIFSCSFLRSFDIASFVRLYRILNQEKPDLVHVHIGLLEVLLLKWLGYPVAYTFHGYGTLYSSQAISGKFLPFKQAFKALTRQLFQKTALGVDALLFVSRSEQQRMRQEGYLSPSEMGQVLYNGLPVLELAKGLPQAEQITFKQQLGLPANARCISYINRLDENKNPLHFLELAQRMMQLCQTSPAQINPAMLEPMENIHFLIAGDGPLAAVVQAQCETLPNMHYLGHRSDVAKLLAISDLVIYPARREGFGLGLVEAMAAGSLCVAYASGGAQEILNTPETQECLVSTLDVEELLHKTCAMLQKPPTEANRLRQALQTRAADFDAARFIEQLESVYRRLVPPPFTPVISVLLPVFNGESIILRAVRSVLNQSYPNLELIVVDDGSQDGTLAQLNMLRDPRLKIVEQPNQGVALARNHGFEYATGDYIAFIDADDLWFPHKLETELRTIQKYAAESSECLVYSSYYAVNETDGLINLPGIFKENGDLSQAVLEHEGIFLPSTTLVHRAVFEAVGGFKASCYHEDRVFFIEACRQFPAYATEQRLVAYRQSLSGRCRRVLQQYDLALQAELSIVETLQPALNPDEIQSLSIRQKRNLIFRFLMYHYTRHARTLYTELEQAGFPPSLFEGKKGRLGLFSLKSGINFLAGARLLVQGLAQPLFAPWWAWKMRQFSNKLS